MISSLLCLGERVSFVAYGSYAVSICLGGGARHISQGTKARQNQFLRERERPQTGDFTHMLCTPCNFSEWLCACFACPTLAYLRDCGTEWENASRPRLFAVWRLLSPMHARKLPWDSRHWLVKYSVYTRHWLSSATIPV